VTVTLHSSWRGLVVNSIGALLVLAGGLLAVNRGGWNVISTSVFLIGVALVAVMLFDYPAATTFTERGVTRRMMLRRQRIEWESMGQLSRTRPGLTSGWRKVQHGGLVAVVGRRRYLLVDRCESADEFDQLESVVGGRARDLLDEVPRPSEAADPTWLYRSAKWAPERRGDR